MALKGLRYSFGSGRSRNDQVATDLRLWLRDELRQIAERLVALIEAYVLRAEKEIDHIMPGYTHLQRAQVSLFMAS